MKDNFNRELEGGGRKRNFIFVKAFYGPESLFHVTVTDNSNSSVMFRMKKDEEDQWKIQAQALEGWIFEMELELGDVIDEENELV